MIRPVTLTTYVLALALGFALFKVKYEVQSLEDNLIKIERQTALDTAAIHVYKASWSTETRPQALAALAARHLELKPMTSAEIGSYDTLPLSEGAPHLDALPAPEAAPKLDLIASIEPSSKVEETPHVSVHRQASVRAAIQVASLPARAVSNETGAGERVASAGDASIDAVLEAMKAGSGSAR